MTYDPWRIETYAFQAEGGLIKIGRCHPGRERQRLDAARKAVEEPVRFLGFLPDDEWTLHQRFAALRLWGEWFQPESELWSYLSKHLRRGYRQQRNRGRHPIIEVGDWSE